MTRDYTRPISVFDPEYLLMTRDCMPLLLMALAGLWALTSYVRPRKAPKVLWTTIQPPANQVWGIERR